MLPYAALLPVPSPPPFLSTDFDSSAEQRLLALIESGGPHDKDELLALFDQLKPISFETLKGEWTGGWFETGHPAGRWMKEIRWVGAAFRSPHDIDPIIARGDDGKKKVLDEWGHAKVSRFPAHPHLFAESELTNAPIQLFEAKFRGLVSAVVVYDKHPIVDYFRSVNDDFVMGLMERTEWRDSGLSFFYLLREKV